jgi:DNA anti-recombination protein RmuC
LAERKLISKIAIVVALLSGLSFSVSEIALQEGDSPHDEQKASSQVDSNFSKPGTPISVQQQKETTRLKKQLEQWEERNAELLQQMEQQRNDLGEEMSRQGEQLEELKAQLKEITSLLKKPRK